MVAEGADGAGGRLAGLRVGVDVRTGGVRRTGVGRYGAVLVETLSEAGAVVEVVTDGDAPLARPRRWLRAAAPDPRPLRRSGAAWLRPDLFREAHVHFTLHGRMMTLACEDPPDVMHWTCPSPMRLAGTRNVYAVHDLIPLEAPGLSGVPAGRHGRLLDAIARDADAIVTVSEASRDAILRRLGGRTLPVVNTYQAVGRLRASATPPDGLPPDGYLLFCGSVEPRKNLRRLIAAYGTSGVTLPLVIAGPPGWRAQDAVPAVPPLGIIRRPWSARPDLLALVAAARALVLPSLAEGFGLPVVEAFALGVPVVAASGGALAEVAGGAALLVDPLDEGDIAAGLARIAADGPLRERLRMRGRARAAEFAASAYVSRLEAAYGAAGVRTPSDGRPGAGRLTARAPTSTSRRQAPQDV